MGSISSPDPSHTTAFTMDVAKDIPKSTLELKDGTMSTDGKTYSCSVEIGGIKHKISISIDKNETGGTSTTRAKVEDYIRATGADVIKTLGETEATLTTTVGSTPESTVLVKGETEPKSLGELRDSPDAKLQALGNSIDKVQGAIRNVFTSSTHAENKEVKIASPSDSRAATLLASSPVTSERKDVEGEAKSVSASPLPETSARPRSSGESAPTLRRASSGIVSGESHYQRLDDKYGDQPWDNVQLNALCNTVKSEMKTYKPPVSIASDNALKMDALQNKRLDIFVKAQLNAVRQSDPKKALDMQTQFSSLKAYNEKKEFIEKHNLLDPITSSSKESTSASTTVFSIKVERTGLPVVSSPEELKLPSPPPLGPPPPSGLPPPLPGNSSPSTTRTESPDEEYEIYDPTEDIDPAPPPSGSPSTEEPPPISGSPPPPPAGPPPPVGGPPPPPLPPSAERAASTPSSGTKDDLLKAIRKGKTLKSAGARDAKLTETKESTTKEEPPDLADALSKAMGARRKDMREDMVNEEEDKEEWD